MRDYAKIYTSLWRSRKFRRLPNDTARLLYLYLHTCPHSNIVGCFILPDGYATTDLGWTISTYREAVDTLCTADLIGYDEAENLVRIVNFLEHDPFTNPSHAAGAVKVALDLPDCHQKSLLINDLRNAPRVIAASLPSPISQPLDSLSTGCHPEPQPQPQPEPHKDGGGGTRDAVSTDREAILTAIGVDPISGITGPSARQIGTRADMAEVARWLDLPGMTMPLVIEEISRVMANKRDGPPSSFKFFTKAMQRLSGELSRDALQPITPANGARNDKQRFDQTIATVAAGLSSGAIGLGLEDRNPFAQRRGQDPEAGEHGSGALLRPGQ